MNTKIVGVLNITPDSCSDGGLYLEAEAAINHAKDMIKAGADIIDVGSVSTRPNGDFVSVDEEISRLKDVMPALKALVKGTGVLISLDSYNHQTLASFMDYIDIINDVTGMENPKMQHLALESGKDTIFMHSMGVPVNNSERCLAENIDVIKFLISWREQKVEQLLGLGFKSENLIFDPGIGFGKNLEQSMTIVLRLEELISPDFKIMIGHSRKVFLSLLGGMDYKNRDKETHAITRSIRDVGVDYLRVHDVAGTKLALGS